MTLLEFESMTLFLTLVKQSTQFSSDEHEFLMTFIVDILYKLLLNKFKNMLIKHWKLSHIS